MKALRLETGEVVGLVAGRFSRFADGRLLYLSPDGTTILTARFDRDDLVLASDPEPLVDGLLGGSSTLALGFAVSRTGVLAYAPRRRWEMRWATANGERAETRVRSSNGDRGRLGESVGLCRGILDRGPAVHGTGR
ncbi:MAG: hypothetical protein R3304_11160 [Longimicrobiales bacterium]|nr:hypothetical protein [Longimicrobiales bacterium]